MKIELDSCGFVLIGRVLGLAAVGTAEAPRRRDVFILLCTDLLGSSYPEPSLHGCVQCVLVVFCALLNSWKVFVGESFHIFQLLALVSPSDCRAFSCRDIKCSVIHDDNFQQTTNRLLD